MYIYIFFLDQLASSVFTAQFTVKLGPIHQKKLYLTNKTKSLRSTSHPMKPHKGYPTGNEEEAVRMEKESVEEGHRNRCG